MSFFFIVIVFPVERSLRLTIVSYVKVYKARVVTIRCFYLLVSVPFNRLYSLTRLSFIKPD